VTKASKRELSVLIVNFALSFRACRWPCSTLPFRLGGAFIRTLYYGKCRTKFCTKCLALRTSDLAKQLIERLTGVAIGSNAYEKQTPQTKVVSDADCQSTLRTPNQLILQIVWNGNAVHRKCPSKQAEQGRQRLTKIRVSLSPYLPTASLPLSYYGKSAAKFLTTSIQNANLRGRKHARPLCVSYYILFI